MSDITLREIHARHKRNHPNDKGVPKKGKGITWSKQSKHCTLDEFYKTHIYTFTDETDLSKREWVRITGFKGEEE